MSDFKKAKPASARKVQENLVEKPSFKLFKDAEGEIMAKRIEVALMYAESRSGVTSLTTDEKKEEKSVYLNAGDLLSGKKTVK